MKKAVLFIALLIAAPLQGYLARAQTAGQFYAVPTTAALAALTTRPPTVYVQGDDASTDLKGGLYNWVAGSAATANGTTIVAPSGAGPSGRWFMQGATGMPAVATNSTTARSMADRLAETVNPKDFGAVGNGVADDTAAFQAAINSVSSGAAVQLFVPPGTYNLASNVTANGRFPSWSMQGSTSFTGAGTLPFPNTDNYGDRGIKNAFLAGQRGDASAPIVDLSALIYLKKVTNGTATSERNPTAVFATERRGVTTANTRAESIFAEILDYAGGDQTFSEGGRFHCILKTGATDGACYGAIAVAGAESSVAWKYLIAHESEVINKTADAPAPLSFDKTHVSAAYLATVGLSGTKNADAGFMTNPFTSGPVFKTGFLVPEDSVDNTAFGNRAAVAVVLGNYGSVTTGFYAGTVSYAAIQLQNGASSVIRARNGANSADHNIFSYSNADWLTLGQDAASVSIPAPLVYAAPTSCSGQPAGVLWNDSGTVKVCP